MKIENEQDLSVSLAILKKKAHLAYILDTLPEISLVPISIVAVWAALPKTSPQRRYGLAPMPPQH